MRFLTLCSLLAVILGASGCASDGAAPPPERDIHSQANPEEAISRHLALDLRVDFEARLLNGRVTHHLERQRPQEAGRFVVDVKDLEIESVRVGRQGLMHPATWALIDGPEDIGDGLEVALAPLEDRVEIRYRTTDAGSGLQWLDPAQTAGGRHPFLFSQSQAIHARTWIPCQDSPGIRVTYEALVDTPAHLQAVMSADLTSETEGFGRRRLHRFRMPQAIPSYLIALAVGDLVFQEMSPRTGVWAEPALVEKAAYEFADTEAMMRTVEQLYGPYRWERYDILVLPPSFPFGGMENPRLTFATPTILAGDRSLVALIAHELAHSWSGNLVTNKTHRDFWLNEGFTVYLEGRIMEAVFGRERFEMECMLAIRDLEEEMGEMEDRDQILHVDLKGRDPDAGFTGVPYDKGAAFLRRLEEVFGRERFDTFLRGYFDRFSFRSITTATFRAHLERELLRPFPQLAASVDVEEWIEGPGLPEDFPRVVSDRFAKIDAAMAAWREGSLAAAAIETSAWTTQEWLHFIGRLDPAADASRLEAVDAAFALTESGNAEILAAWLELATKAEFAPVAPRLESFLIEVGRRKFLTPLYRALLEVGDRERALTIYRQARPRYHAIARRTIDDLLSWQG
jgi:leukotriene-A4 hydrolase